MLPVIHKRNFISSLRFTSAILETSYLTLFNKNLRTALFSTQSAQAPATAEPLGPAPPVIDRLRVGVQWQGSGCDPDRGSDDLAGDHQLHAAILLAPFRGVIRCHGLRLAESLGRH